MFQPSALLKALYLVSNLIVCLVKCGGKRIVKKSGWLRAPDFSGMPEGPFCLSCIFIFRKERNWMKKSARVWEKMVSLGLPYLQVATRLEMKNNWTWSWTWCRGGNKLYTMYNEHFKCATPTNDEII